MLIRANAARRLMKRGEIDGPSALEMIVLPSDEVLEASLAATPDQGTVTLARYLFEKPREGQRRRKRRPSLPMRLRQRQEVSLDQALAELG